MVLCVRENPWPSHDGVQGLVCSENIAPTWPSHDEVHGVMRSERFTKFSVPSGARSREVPRHYKIMFRMSVWQ